MAEKTATPVPTFVNTPQALNGLGAVQKFLVLEVDSLSKEDKRAFRNRAKMILLMVGQ